MTTRTHALASAVRPLTAGLAAAALAVAVASCSGSDGGSGNAQPSSPAGSDPTATCGVHKVGEVQVRTFCGTGTAAAKSAKVDLSLKKAQCETSTNYLAVNAGTVVLGADDAAKKLKATTQYVGLTVGQVPGDTTSKPAPTDGFYTGGILAVNDKGTALLPDPKSLKVTLTKGRTAGSFSGALVGGGTVTGSFTCA